MGYKLNSCTNNYGTFMHEFCLIQAYINAEKYLVRHLTNSLGELVKRKVNTNLLLLWIQEPVASCIHFNGYVYF